MLRYLNLDDFCQAIKLRLVYYLDLTCISKAARIAYQTHSVEGKGKRKGKGKGLGVANRCWKRPVRRKSISRLLFLDNDSKL